MPAKITLGELTGLDPKHAVFVVEYIKDFNAALAAERAGYNRSYASALMENQSVLDAISRVVTNRLRVSHIDAEWVLMQLVENHVLARQDGKLSASNTALANIMRHANVDALAADKVHVAGDEEVMARLLRGRARVDNESDQTTSTKRFSFL